MTLSFEESIKESSTNKGRHTLHMLIGVALFFVLTFLTVLMLNELCTPYQNGTHTKETIRGMYAQQRDSVQVAFFGASNMLSAASPMTLYREFGINGYNCASSVQPLLISYWLLIDLYNSQSGSLSTVVIDPSIILRTSDAVKKPAWAERVLINMPLSDVKIHAIFDFCREYKAELTEEIFPLLNYHSRWNQLAVDDFDLVNDVSNSTYSHGEFIRYQANVENETTAARSSKTNALITDTIDFADDELATLYEERSLRYLEKIVSFCNGRKLNIVFVKTPKTSWDDKSHDALKKVADKFGIPFVDMSTKTFMEKYDLSYPLDFVDEKHPNIHGSEKISRFLGSYLLEHYHDFKPINPNAIPRIEEDLDRYTECYEDGQLLLCKNLEAYFDLINDERYTVFVATKGIIPKNLSENLANKIKEFGMSKLTSAHDNEGYVCVRNNGRVVKSTLASENGKTAAIEGQFNGYTLIAEETKLQKGTKFRNAFEVKTSGTTSEGATSIKVGGLELSEDSEGINFAVFNSNTGELVDTSCFELETNEYNRTSDQTPSETLTNRE